MHLKHRVRREGKKVAEESVRDNVRKSKAGRFGHVKGVDKVRFPPKLKN